MAQYISRISLLVKEYDEAIQFYTQKLQFELLEDTDLGNGKRWVLISPKGNGNCVLLLAKAKNEAQLSSVGNQTGGRVFLFLYTDDFWTDYNRMVKQGVEIVRQPSTESFGTVTVFKDLYGNLWDFIQPNNL